MNKLNLYDFQTKTSNFIYERLLTKAAVLDCSVVGSGKTYVAIDVLIKLNLPYIIICPKIVIPQWEKIIDEYDFNKNNLLVTNYEKIKFGKFKYYQNEKWNLPKNTIVIFDEAHKLKGYKTLNSNLLLTLDLTQYKLYLISATIADNPLSFVNVAKMLKITNNEYIFFREYGCKKEFNNKGWKFDGNQEHLVKLHNILFNNPNHPGVRISDKDIKKYMPEQIIDLYYIHDHYDKINSLYLTLLNESNTQLEMSDIENDDIENDDIENDDISELLNSFCDSLLSSKTLGKCNLKEVETKIKTLENLLVKRTRLKQLIEIIKVKLLVELIQELYENDYSIVVILNFTLSINLLNKLLLKVNLNNETITGMTKNKQDIINNFQQDKLRIVIVNIKAAGIGISLHDLNGKYKRISLISPSENIYELQQALGRIYRTGCKTNVIQYIVTVKKTIEESVHSLYKSKLKNMTTILEG